MSSKIQIKASLPILLILSIMGQGCGGVTPAVPLPTVFTATKTLQAEFSSTADFVETESLKRIADSPTPLVTNTLTPVPPGVFALLIYPPLVMNYDLSTWRDESRYEDVHFMALYAVRNYLQSINLETCQIGIQGPTGDFPATPEAIQLDSVSYEVITFVDSPPGFVTAYYIENKSISGFNYGTGTSVLVLQASRTQWNECKALAQEVLSTLHVP